MIFYTNNIFDHLTDNKKRKGETFAFFIISIDNFNGSGALDSGGVIQNRAL